MTVCISKVSLVSFHRVRSECQVLNLLWFVEMWQWPALGKGRVFSVTPVTPVSSPFYLICQWGSVQSCLFVCLLLTDVVFSMALLEKLSVSRADGKVSCVPQLLRMFQRKKKKRRLEISAPKNFEHRVHTSFDPVHGCFVGLPPQWQSLIETLKRPKPVVDPSNITRVQLKPKKVCHVSCGIHENVCVCVSVLFWCVCKCVY